MDCRLVRDVLRRPTNPERFWHRTARLPQRRRCTRGKSGSWLAWPFGSSFVLKVSTSARGGFSPCFIHQRNGGAPIFARTFVAASGTESGFSSKRFVPLVRS